MKKITMNQITYCDKIVMPKLHMYEIICRKNRKTSTTYIGQIWDI